MIIVFNISHILPLAHGKSTLYALRPNNVKQSCNHDINVPIGTVKWTVDYVFVM